MTKKPAFLLTYRWAYVEQDIIPWPATDRSTDDENWGSFRCLFLLFSDIYIIFQHNVVIYIVIYSLYAKQYNIDDVLRGKFELQCQWSVAGQAIGNRLSVRKRAIPRSKSQAGHHYIR
jgi:predicted Co/Zn/Cd cation transporter (cation efflux family)